MFHNKTKKAMVAMVAKAPAMLAVVMVKTKAVVALIRSRKRVALFKTQTARIRITILNFHKLKPKKPRRKKSRKNDCNAKLKF